ITWSPDSTRLLRVAIHPNMKRLEVLVTDAETGTNRVVFQDTDDRWVFSSSALWSPNGRDLLIMSERDGYAHLYKTPAAGGDVIQLTHGKWETFPGRFNSDAQWAGDYIYFGSTEVSTAERHFYRMHADGSGANGSGANGSGKEQLSHGVGIHRGYVASDGT